MGIPKRRLMEESDFRGFHPDMRGEQYYHYAVYVGNGRIVSFDTGETIVMTDISKVFGKMNCEMHNLRDRTRSPKASHEIVEFALSQMGKVYNYSVNHQNSKLFAELCLYGDLKN